MPESDVMVKLRRIIMALSPPGAPWSFWTEFRRAVVSRLAAAGDGDDLVYSAYATFLQDEVHLRRRYGNFCCSAGVTKWGDAWGQRRSAAAWLLMKTVEACAGEATTVGHELVAAEACLHLQDFAGATTHLKAAVCQGACEPIIHLALGCAAYADVKQPYTKEARPSGTEPGELPAERRRALLQAVDCLERGISGGPLDGVLYRWLSEVLEAAGFQGAARFAHEQAMQAAVAMRDTGQEAWSGEPWWTQEQAVAWRDELRQVAQALGRTHTRAEVSGSGSGS